MSLRRKMNFSGLRVTFSREGISTVKEAWHEEPIEEVPRKTDTVEYADQLSELETKLREVLEMHARRLGQFRVAQLRAADVSDTLVDEFHRLAAQWREDTVHYSNINKAILHPAYQQIIGMGKARTLEIVGLLLRELEERPDHWFRALIEIVGTDAAIGEDTFEGAIQAWLNWGYERGYLTTARSAA